ncbi:hypothetical protein F7725_028466 [Dissostichus mawsoni]|uniref:Uncharacterized protein n=1 Tax=Dissostichus mawsoni TaxID=36200 RepID=A0A7J5XI84_DISMA|nr:hypothetical protein F7725_028466 [Dissostichus mawsoni]
MSVNQNISLASMWYCPKPPPSMDNTIIRFSCSIVKQLHRRLNIEGLSLPSCPIWSNPCLSAGGGTLSNNIWQKAGITTIGQIYRDQTLPFQQLKNQYGLSDSSFLSYAQIASIISTKCKEGAMPASCMEEDQRLKKAIISSGVVSNIYKLLSRAAPNTYSPVQLSWEHDLNISLSALQWNSIWRSAMFSSKCERKPACFTRDSWLREYLDLLNMERAASLLGDFEGRQDTVHCPQLSY